MSTRLYPAYKEGCKQLRVYLPNFWMKMLKPTHNLLPNQVQFLVSPQMTKFDVQQYLEKIYKVPVVNVAVYNHIGKTKTTGRGYIIKNDDDKIAFVTLPKDQTFVFPDLFGAAEEEEKKNKNSLEEIEVAFKKKTAINVSKQGIPSWFSH